MCGRFVATTPSGVLAARFSVDEIADEGPAPSWNVAPTADVRAVVRSRRTGARRLGTLRWGLVPHWAEHISVGAKMINARAETVASKPAFRDALARRRCIIPADGFYEWQSVGGGKLKQAYLVRRADGEPMALAGLWESWRPPDATEDEWLRTCAIVTTRANDDLLTIHPRMPVVLGSEAWEGWLDSDMLDAEAAVALLGPAPTDALVHYPVGNAVNDARHDGPELAEPLASVAAGGEDPEPPSGARSR
ncbi:MAG: hypothetical protein DLM54_02605 [Acidimicrobiales bacterium]|nr:MAG: hypothetical protein DLM54_02605 [Acidimicrobiales bacterium]